MTVHRQPILLLALAALLLVGLSACGGDSSSTTTEATPAGAVPFDRAFIDGMVPHHEGAIEMANAAKDAGLSVPELVELADDIAAAQQQEIDQMKAWREAWFGSAEIDPMGAETLGLSEAEMGMQHDASSFATAEDVDGEFASMMIDHHEGAITMARLALERAEHQEIKDLAERIIEAQEREIGVMESHASAMDGEGH